MRKTAAPPKHFSREKFRKTYQPLLVQAEAEMLGSGETLYNILSLAASGREGADLLPDPVFTHTDLWKAVKYSTPISLLRLAAHEGHSEAYKKILSWMLIELDVRAPEGVIMPFRNDPGRPKTGAIKDLCRKWDADGRPEITSALCDKYAALFHPSEHARAKPYTKPYKNLIDKIRTPLLNYQKSQSATDSPR